MRDFGIKSQMYHNIFNVLRCYRSDFRLLTTSVIMYTDKLSWLDDTIVPMLNPISTGELVVD